MESKVLKTCDVCGEAVEVELVSPFNGEPLTVGRIQCSCEASKESKRMERERARRLERARLRCFGDADYSEAVFANDDGKTPGVMEVAKGYADKFQAFKYAGNGLLMYGATGNGKTFYAACIANALIERGYKVEMQSIPDLVEEMRRARENVVARVSKPDLFIADDLGVESGSEFRQECVYAIVNARYKARKPIIVTTNLTLGQLMRPDDLMGDRIYSRILERCLPVEFVGADRRAANSDYAKMIEILGS